MLFIITCYYVLGTYVEWAKLAMAQRKPVAGLTTGQVESSSCYNTLLA